MCARVCVHNLLIFLLFPLNIPLSPFLSAKLVLFLRFGSSLRCSSLDDLRQRQQLRALTGTCLPPVVDDVRADEDGTDGVGKDETVQAELVLEVHGP